MASLATIFKQVAREGARWGLFPLMRDGKVKVCERVAELPLRENAPKIVEYAPRVVASLDENSGLDALSAILLHRISRFRHDFAAQMIRAQSQRQAAEQQVVDDRRKQFRAFLKRSNNRIVSVGPAGL